MTITVSSILFASAVCLIFYNVRETLRLQLLAAASILYVFLLDRYAGWAVLITSVFTWGTGLLISRFSKKGNDRMKNIVSVIGIAVSTVSLILLKYVPSFALNRFESDHFITHFLIPLGFSYYIFQTISYFADLMSGRMHAVGNIFHLILYLSWFPRFVSGPIERTDEFIKEMNSSVSVRFAEPERWTQVIHYVVIGCFMKMVIADRLGVFVDIIFEKCDGFAAPVLLFGILAYAFQIYFDFAGYSYVAVGISQAFGIRLTDNFKMPYFSANITEFWRRWHISLSRWLRDYVYIPLGGNRRGKTRKILNTMIVFLICGAWHGTGFGFIIWGLLHGVYSAADSILSDKGVKAVREGVIGRILTFIGVCFAWLFFRAPSLDKAFLYLRTIQAVGLRLHSLEAELYVLGLDRYEMLIIAASILGILILEYTAYKRDILVPKMTAGMHAFPRYLLIFVLLASIVIFGMYGPAFDSSKMIYMQF
ncbi:MAG: MBOAT family protein [Lachnospiraceae bacterium]|nr:MBOAT family protein [Lachnospiraceae bacterium]